MRVEELLTPISPDAPCGDDLLAADDPDFVDYYFNVEERLPTSYFNVVRDELFDPKSLDHKAETAQIEPLLKRSRDLRLLGLDAKFQVLAGRFNGFAQAVLGMDALLAEYPDDVHPQDSTDRQNAIEELCAAATVIAPLDYAVLLNDRRIGDIIYRGYGTAVGTLTKRTNEAAGDSAAVISALGSSENAAAVEDLFTKLTDLRSALARMAVSGRSRPDPYTANLDRLDEKLRQILDMVLAARGDLAAPAAEATEAGEEGEPAEAVEGDAPAVASAAGMTVTLQPTGPIANHRHAYRTLQALERYFALNEPASLALVLVTQSRLLFGRPLVEALDSLISASAEKAVISFGTDAGFKIPMTRLRELSGMSSVQPASHWDEPAADEPPVAEIVVREQAGQVLKQVEDFFRAREPASPIPILLFKARSLLGKDFHALVGELIPKT